MSDTYRPPAETAALDQAAAFIREDADREKVAILVREDQKFCAGVSHGLGMIVRYADAENIFLPLPLKDLADAWQDLMDRRFGA